MIESWGGLISCAMFWVVRVDMMHGLGLNVAGRAPCPC